MAGQAWNGMERRVGARNGEARNGRAGVEWLGSARNLIAQQRKGIIVAAKNKVVSYEAPRFERYEFEVKGTTPLIVHAFSAKAKKQIEDKQQKRGKSARAARSPKEEFEAAKYLTQDGRDAVLAAAFKESAIRGAKHCGLVMKDAMSSFFIEAEKIPIDFDECVMREDMVRIGRGSADIRYRPEYHGWSTSFEVTINANLISLDQLVACFKAAGFGVGVGDWRPERGGNHGRFSVVKVRQIQEQSS